MKLVIIFVVFLVLINLVQAEHREICTPEEKAAGKVPILYENTYDWFCGILTSGCVYNESALTHEPKYYSCPGCPPTGCPKVNPPSQNVPQTNTTKIDENPPSQNVPQTNTTKIDEICKVDEKSQSNINNIQSQSLARNSRYAAYFIVFLLGLIIGWFLERILRLKSRHL